MNSVLLQLTTITMTTKQILGKSGRMLAVRKPNEILVGEMVDFNGEYFSLRIYQQCFPGDRDWCFEPTPNVVKCHFDSVLLNCSYESYPLPGATIKRIIVPQAFVTTLKTISSQQLSPRRHERKLTPRSSLRNLQA